MRTLGTLLMGMAACSPDPATPPPLTELELPGGHRFELDPPVVSQDTTVQVRLRSRRSALVFDDTALELAQSGLSLRSFAVLDGFTAFAELDVASDAPIGSVAGTLTVGDETWQLPELLTVVAEGFVIEPGNAKMGEVIDVVLTGRFTSWEPNITWASFGRDVQTIAVEVSSPTELHARIAIASDAQPGFRDITVEQAEGVLTLYDGFTVDREVITASWDPPVVSQGDTINFRIEGVNTRFGEDVLEDQVQFWNQTAPVADLVFQSFVRESATVITGVARVSNAARPGMRDVFIDDEEDLLIARAFEIRPTPLDPLNARLGIRFDVSRRLSPATGLPDDSIRASAVFVIPLDPPCSVGFNAAAGPIPFDINGVFPAPPAVTDPVDCPEPLTVDAGAFVWFEGPTNTVTLHRDINPNTGQIFYRGRDLSLADYHFGDTYGLRAQGAEGGIPPFFVENAQPTVPEDYRFTEPNFAGLEIDRFEDFDFSWTEAGVYPVGQFVISLTGTLLDTGEGGYVGVLPFDDGQHRFRPNQLSQLAAGDAVFSAFSRVEGRVFELPFNGARVQSDSMLTTEAPVVLR